MYYHTLNEELRRRFGCKVYKLALDGGFTCPNRDGTIGARGCIFCAGDGSGAFAADRALDIPQQIEAAKARVAGKNGGGSLIYGFDQLVEKDTGIRTTVVDDALSCAAFGSGKMLMNLNDMPDGMVNLARKRQMKA